MTFNFFKQKSVCSASDFIYYLLMIEPFFCFWKNFGDYGDYLAASWRVTIGT